MFILLLKTKIYRMTIVANYIKRAITFLPIYIKSNLYTHIIKMYSNNTTLK